MPSNLELLGDGYSSISSKGSRDLQSTESIPQEKLFKRVSELLNNAGVTIRGSGSLALDLDENGKIELIGNIENKDVIAAALEGDSELLAILKDSSPSAGNNSTASTTSKWSQEAYCVELNGKVFVEDLGEYLDTTVNEEITGSYYGEFNTSFKTDEFGFKEDSGADFAFTDCMFDDREERDELFNYIKDKLSENIEGFSSMAGMRFDLVNEEVNGKIKHRLTVESANGEESDRLAEDVLNENTYIEDTFIEAKMSKGNKDCVSYGTVLGAYYDMHERGELNLDFFGRKEGSIRHYSPETESNRESIEISKKIWDIAKNASAKEIEEYMNHSKDVEKWRIKDAPEEKPIYYNPYNPVDYSSYASNSKKSKMVSTVLSDTENVAPGTEVASAKVVEQEKSSTRTIIRDNGNIRDLLGLNTGRDEDLSTLLSDLTTKIKSLNEGVSTQINDILAEQGMTLGEDEKVDIGVAEDGTITVTANEGGTEARARAEKLQEALNSNSDTANELAGSLQELDINQTALTELVTDHGLSNDTAHRLYKILPDSETKKQLSAFFEGDDDIAETEFSQETKSFTISNGAIINDDIDATLAHLDRTAQFSVMTELMRYNEVSYDDETGELLSPEAPPDMRIQSYEAILDEEGNIEVIGGLNGEGNELNGRLKGIAEKILDQDALGTSFKTLATLLIEKHGYEDSDTDEYEHEVKISVDYSRMDVSYEVISPEADQAAEKELGDSLREISQSVSSYLEEEYGFDSPVEIKVDENGKLSASTDSLTDQQTMQLESVIEMLNQTLVMSEDVEEGESTSGAAFTGGLKEAFDGVTGLKDILAKFHDKENLYKAIG